MWRDDDGDGRRDDDGREVGERIPVGDGPLVEGEDENHPSLSRGCVLDVWMRRLLPAIAGGDGGADGRTWAKRGEVGGDGGADEAVRRWRDGGREVRRRADEAVRDLHAGPTDQKKKVGADIRVPQVGEVHLSLCSAQG